jgi:hypothetical protein
VAAVFNFWDDVSICFVDAAIAAAAYDNTAVGSWG